MATVYLAHDVRHQRDVAIKVLHEDLGAALGAERFLSEIRMTARLQHPHILPLLDSGNAAGLLFYVMPLATGETLRDRLTRERQLPLDDALRIAREVADALGYAHAQNIIHRDIKPENILLQGSHAVVADFGIALAVQQAGGQRMTQTGLSLGTPQYMSPEQAMGERVIDGRSDVYALGAVTYEMLTGDPPFTGSSVQAIVAKVLVERPTPPSTVRDTIPAGVEEAVLKALAKLPADRFATPSDFASALSDRTMTSAAPVTRQTVGAPAPRARWRDPLVLALGAGVLVLAGVAATLASRTRANDNAFPMRSVIAADDEAPVGYAALSPDGQSIVYPGRARSGMGRVLYVRRLDQLTPREIPGTEDPAGAAVFAPDGKSVAYIAGRRRLVRAAIDGSESVTLAEVSDFGGVDWSPNGDIIVGAGVDEGLQGLFRISAAGGSLTPFTRVDTVRKELSHQVPRALADGKTVLFTIWFGSSKASELAVTSLDDGTVIPLGVAGLTALNVIDGQLVYVNTDGVIMAVPFNARQRRVEGTPTVVQEDVRINTGGGSDHKEVFLTHAGGLVYARGNENRRLVWVDRHGVKTPVLDAEREFLHVRLSPDGRHIAASIIAKAQVDIWTIDANDGTLTRLTTTGASRNPVWSADGRRILYGSTHGGRAAFWWQSADGSGAAELAVVPPHNPWFVDLAPDGRSVVYNAIYNGTFNLEVVPLDSSGRPRDLIASPTAIERNARFSPDGKWVAHISNESGRDEVYVRPFIGSGGRLQVSAAGGGPPVWSRDGREIFYRAGGRMIAATMAFQPEPRVVSRVVLFAGQYMPDYDVSADGKRFLMVEPGATGVGLVAIPNWRTELRRLTRKP